MTKPAKQHVHFWSNDYRFCGSRQNFREFSFEDHEVTCPKCLQRSAAELAKFTALITVDAVAKRIPA